jgi:small-conductance mechanosensitive channel
MTVPSFCTIRTCTKNAKNHCLIAMALLFRLVSTLLLVVASSANNVPHQLLNDIAEGAERVKHTVQDTLHDADELLHHEFDSLIKDSALAGNILPVIQKLVITPEKAKLMLQKTAEVIDWQDFVFLVFLGWCTVPLLKLPMENIILSRDDAMIQPRKRFQDTVAFHVADNLSQIARLAMLVYGMDVIKIFLTCMGFTFPHLQELPKNFAKIIYTLWVVVRISKLKSNWISSLISKQPTASGRAKIMDRLLDAGLAAITLSFLFDILSFQLGFTGKSVFAIGSVGTLVVSLASQGLATQVLNGLLLTASDRIYEGDKVRFGNGISGTVVKLGWMETIIRGTDEILLTVPNADLASERVSNLSRIHRSQVKQTLRFQYKDADMLPVVVGDIKKEIITSCPELITDGTRPFRVHWRSYGDDHLEVVVDAHFHIKPEGDAYWDNRQEVLMAIRRAVKKHDIEFAIATN